jgi:hypothetical protein
VSPWIAFLQSWSFYAISATTALSSSNSEKCTCSKKINHKMIGKSTQNIFAVSRVSNSTFWLT